MDPDFNLARLMAPKGPADSYYYCYYYKRVALIKGRTSENPLASQTPRASNPARAAVLEYLLTNAASLDSASSRWNGCGCRDVLWWSPVLAHRRRGPRSGHITLIQKAPAALSPRPHAGGLPGRW